MRLGLPLRAAVATTAVTALLVSLSACGSDPKEGPIASKGDDPTPSASTSPSAEPPPALPSATRNTAAGRIAFAKYFVNALTYTYATNDPAPITDVASKAKATSCEMCTKLATYLRGQKFKGLHLEPSNLPVLKVYETARPLSNVWVLDVQSNAPARADVDSSGTKVRNYPAKKNYIVEVGVAWEDNAYRVTGWKAGENS